MDNVVVCNSGCHGLATHYYLYRQSASLLSRWVWENIPPFIFHRFHCSFQLPHLDIMGQAISKIRKFHQDKQQQATPNQNYQLPRTVDSSGDPVAADAKLLDGRQFKKSGSPVYPFPNDKGVGEFVPTSRFLTAHGWGINVISRPIIGIWTIEFAALYIAVSAEKKKKITFATSWMFQ